MGSEALRMTVAMLSLYGLILLSIVLGLFFKQRVRAKQCIVASLSLIICAGVTLSGVYKLKQLSDGYEEGQFKSYLDQVNSQLNDIKYNQGVTYGLQKNEEKQTKLKLEQGGLQDKHTKKDIDDLKHFESWLLFFEFICALLSIPLAVNLFVYGVTSRGVINTYYEIPHEVIGRISSLESAVNNLVAINIGLVFIFIIYVLIG